MPLSINYHRKTKLNFQNKSSPKSRLLVPLGISNCKILTWKSKDCVTNDQTFQNLVGALFNFHLIFVVSNMLNCTGVNCFHPSDVDFSIFKVFLGPFANVQIYHEAYNPSQKNRQSNHQFIYAYFFITFGELTPIDSWEVFMVLNFAPSLRQWENENYAPKYNYLESKKVECWNSFFISNFAIKKNIKEYLQ